MVTKRTRPSGMAHFSQADDFTAIQGIGRAVNNRLHEAGILTFAQLAALSPGDILASIGSFPGLSRKRITAQDWSGQALELADSAAASHPSIKKLPKDRQRYATFTVELLIDETNCLRRTHIIHIQSSGEMSWTGWDRSKLLDFIIASGEFNTPSEDNILTAGNSLHATEPIREKVPRGAGALTETSRLGGMLHMKEFVILPKGSVAPRMIIAAGQPYSVRITLDLSEVTPIRDLLNYQLTVNAKNIFGGSRQMIKQTDGMVSWASPLFVVEGMPLPPGTYRLEAIISLTQLLNQATPQPIVGSLEGPLLQVY